MSVLRRNQIKWIAERFLRESLKDHAKERNWFTHSQSWKTFLKNISMDRIEVTDQMLTSAVKDAVIEYVRQVYRARTGRDPSA